MSAAADFPLNDCACHAVLVGMRGFGPVRATGSKLNEGQVLMQGLLGNSGTLLFPLLMFAALYFLMIAPNQRKQKKWQEMLGQLKSGDRVTTSGGVRGVIVSVKDDVVQLRVAPDNIKLEFVKSSIASVTTPDEH